MKSTLTEKLLLFLADWFDLNEQLSWRNFNVMSGDPRFKHHRRWMEKYLDDQGEKRKLYLALQNLKRRKILQERVMGNSHGYILSNKGRLKILYLKTKQLDKKKFQNNWWLMVAFDIPEKLRKTRDFFRKILHELGFEQLQKSVWVTPYDVIKEVQEVIKNYRLEDFVKSLFVKENHKK